MTTSPTTQLLLNVLSGRDSTPQDVDWPRALYTLQRHRLAGLAWRLPAVVEGAPEDVRLSLEASYRKQAIKGSVLVEHGLAVTDLLTEARIPVLMFKGASLVASGVYSSSGERAFSDVDLLVPPGYARRAVDLLVSEGYPPWNKDVRETLGWSDAANFSLKGDGALVGGAIDLHWRLDYGGLRYGREDEDARDSWPTDSAPSPGLQYLSPELHLAISLEHVLKHLRFRIHLPGLCDAVRLAPRIRDWERVQDYFTESPWGRGCQALLVNLGRESGCFPEEVLRQFDVPGLPVDLLRLDRLVDRVRLGATPIGGLRTRWQITGPETLVSDFGDALFPPTPWLRARYGKPKGLVLGLWVRHVTRMCGWALGIATSPLSPNQDPPDA